MILCRMIGKGEASHQYPPSSPLQSSVTSEYLSPSSTVVCSFDRSFVFGGGGLRPQDPPPRPAMITKKICGASPANFLVGSFFPLYAHSDVQTSVQTLG